MSGDSLEIVASTGDAAYATDGKGHIVAWNKAAERLLGFDARRVLGKCCYRIMRGTDLFGNRFCDERCPLVGMAQRREPVNKFELNVETADSGSMRVDMSVLFPPQTHSELSIIHILTPVEPAKHARGSHRPVREIREAITRLTPREVEVLAVLSEGMNTKEVAEALCISVETVRNHVKHILFKLKVNSRIEAIILNRRNCIT